jgi:alkanesulfonate monooxygenase SsuD/methylene tetrahydromethanopterin reductase-like flavin-dependent oxidoreductase (luciferase family)
MPRQRVRLRSKELLMPDLDQIKQGEQVSARPARGRSLKPPTIEDGVRAGGFLAGRPEDIIEQLKAVEKRYPGLDRVICATPLGTPLDVQLEELDRFAKEVIPAFRDTRTAAAAQ